MSLFSESLKSLLDDNDFFSRSEWAQYLTIKEEKINKWLSDEEIPSSHKLLMILTTLEHSSDVDKKPLAKFHEMSLMKATEVSPLGALMLPTVMEYTRRPIFSELASKLAKMTDDEKKTFLLETYGG